MSSFLGRWITTYGPMELRQSENSIRGTYWYQGIPCRIEGEVQDGRFAFRYEDPSGPGQGWFELAGAGEFQGQYRLDGTDHWVPWVGRREWAGIWETSFGRMRLIQEEGRIHGRYDGAVPGKIEGKLEGKRFVFRYFEPTVQGEGWFELANDAISFKGAWRPDGAPAWGDWIGRRVFPQLGLTWLVVIEAHWQRSLGDAEYSYGEMLKAFFARVPSVVVRQRYFNDAPSLERWCRELVYVPEPAIVLISSHGTEAGVGVHGHTIDAKMVVDNLRDANNIQLLHFATCLVLKEDSEGDFARKVGKTPYPISGYAASIDWGGSAILEFNYFDLMFTKRMPPEQAYERMKEMISWAGDSVPPGTPYGAACFRYFRPTE